MSVRRRRLIFIVLATIAVLVSGTLISHRMVYPSPASHALPKIQGGELLRVAHNGHETCGYFTQRGARLVVIFHGNHSTLKREEPIGLELATQGISSLIVEYPGYGVASSRRSDEASIYDDASALVQHVQAKYGFTRQSTTFWGRSLGSGVAAELAHRSLGGRLILVTPYTSIIKVAEHKTMRWLPYLFVWDRFDTLSKAPGIRMPVLIIHGDRDTLTPIEMGYELKTAFPHASMIVLPATGHFDIYRNLKREHWKKVFSFLQA